MLFRSVEAPADARTTRGRRRAVAAAPGSDAKLAVRVINGDLTYVAEPLMLGHYRSSRLTGTEAVMDGLLNGEMTETLAARLYPEAIGSHRVFINRHPNFERSALPRPKAVIIAGLGEEGRLKGADLVEAVKKASLAWAQACDTDTDTPAVEHNTDGEDSGLSTTAMVGIGVVVVLALGGGIYLATRG